VRFVGVSQRAFSPVLLQRTLIMCGFPNVGKSSFLNKVTRADVEVQPYAFTTKSLFVGHMDYKVRFLGERGEEGGGGACLVWICFTSMGIRVRYGRLESVAGCKDKRV
jgi:hypothetical protein